MLTNQILLVLHTKVPITATIMIMEAVSEENQISMEIWVQVKTMVTLTSKTLTTTMRSPSNIWELITLLMIVKESTETKHQVMFEFERYICGKMSKDIAVIV